MIDKVVIVAGGSPDLWPDLQQYEKEQIAWIGVDRGAHYLLQRGISPDIAVGDFDSLSARELAEVKENVAEVHSSIPEKDDTDTQLAIKLALSRYPNVMIDLIGATGGRLDHFLANLWMPLEDRFEPHLGKITLLDSQNTITYYLPGRYTVTKEPDKKYLAYVCLTAVSNFTIYRAKYCLDNYEVKRPMSFASNEFTGNTSEFSFKTGIMAVIQSKDIREE